VRCGSTFVAGRLKLIALTNSAINGSDQSRRVQAFRRCSAPRLKGASVHSDRGAGTVETSDGLSAAKAEAEERTTS
jgi:hypothetical protein